MDTRIHQILNDVFEQLPVASEEGGEHTLFDPDRFVAQYPSSQAATAEAWVQMLQQSFQMLGLLDESTLSKGAWRFVSFPASLFARSLLASLKTPEQSLFERGFWLPQDSMSPVSERQRKLLHTLEEARQNHNAAAQPIRFVHVAWGVIVIGGQILLRHREDKTRPDAKNYVLVGGRLNQHDLREAGVPEPQVLQTLQSPFAASNDQALSIALKREVNEETGLQPRDFQAKRIRTLAPYRAIEGAAANHALTEYRIHLYQIELAESGYFQLLKRVAEDDALTWFDLHDFKQACTADGKRAYIDALIEDHQGDQKAWHHTVDGFQPSYCLEPIRKAETVTFPGAADEFFYKGKTGKERPIAVTISDEECALLQGLALLARRERLDKTVPHVTCLAGGWVFTQDERLTALLQRLSEKLMAAGLDVLQCLSGSYFRIKLPPDAVALSDSLFCYRLDAGKLQLARNALVTPVGAFMGRQSTIISLSINLSNELEVVAARQPLKRFSLEDLQKVVRREIRPDCVALGARTFLRTSQDTLHIPIRREDFNPFVL